MKRKRILYLIPYIGVGDGSTSAVLSQLSIDMDICDEYLIVSQYIGKKPQGYNIVAYSESKTVSDFIAKGNLIVHYFKSGNTCFFSSVIKKIPGNVPVLMTVCQNPAFDNYLLSPNEIRCSWHIVFIDRTSLECKLVNFIPQERKSLVYCCGKDIQKPTGGGLPFKKNDSDVIYGRGSTLNKCPSNMFEVFDKIEVPNKKFVVVGIPEGDNWVRKEASRRENVIVLPQLSYDLWKIVCNSFDVFLYQLPTECHASLDGTLGLAIKYSIPVVYMGCAAPKERFIHKENGYVATSVNEMADYATILGKDKQLRKSIGEKGREYCLNTVPGPYQNRINKYHKIINDICSTGQNKRIKVPFTYYLKYLRRCPKQAFQEMIDIFGIFQWYVRIKNNI